MHLTTSNLSQQSKGPLHPKFGNSGENGQLVIRYTRLTLIKIGEHGLVSLGKEIKW